MRSAAAKAAALVIVTVVAALAAAFITIAQNISTQENERVLNKLKFDISSERKKTA